MSEDQDAIETEAIQVIESESMVPAVAHAEPGAGALMSLTETRAQINHIQYLMRQVMIEDTHYGKIPGCKKPSLFKPGAEKLGLVFRLGPRMKSVKRLDFPNYHREFTVVCELFHIPTGNVVGEGMGSCSTLESKYRYRKGGLKCPACGEPTIKISQYGKGGYYCYAKMGGCNEKFSIDNRAITSQDPSGRTENPDIADTYNTVLKMAKKRAQIDAILSATAASDIFTQDVEDLESAKEADNSLGTPTGNGKDKRQSRAPHTSKQRKKNQERPKVPPRAKNKKTRIVEIKSREVKSGSLAGMVRWGFLITEGIWLNTHDETLVDVAEEGKNGAIVSYHFEEVGQCYVLDDIEADPDIPDTPGSQESGSNEGGTHSANEPDYVPDGPHQALDEEDIPF